MIKNEHVKNQFIIIDVFSISSQKPSNCSNCHQGSLEVWLDKQFCLSIFYQLLRIWRSSLVVRASDCQCTSWVLGSIPASVGTVESEGRQMKQCWILYEQKRKKSPPPKKIFKKIEFEEIFLALSFPELIRQKIFQTPCPRLLPQAHTAVTNTL